jgi:hypothetical protein
MKPEGGAPAMQATTGAIYGSSKSPRKSKQREIPLQNLEIIKDEEEEDGSETDTDLEDGPDAKERALQVKTTLVKTTLVRDQGRGQPRLSASGKRLGRPPKKGTHQAGTSSMMTASDPNSAASTGESAASGNSGRKRKL